MILHSSSHALYRIAVVGGGASGVFASIAAASSSASSCRVSVLEAGSKTLSKVKISGGGRCNVMHDASKPIPDYLNGYPRGSKQLNGLLSSRFSPRQAREWFERRGVELKTEDDGRMFPTTDSSQTIIDTLLSASRNVGVDIQTRLKVISIVRTGDDEQFQVTLKRGDADVTTESFEAVILATGSGSLGYQIAQSMGHSIVEPVPSLFTLSTEDVKQGFLLNGLAGVSVPYARVSISLPSSSSPKSKRLAQEGPLLITHQGLSGPAALRLSAFGARELAAAKYQGALLVHWAPSLGTTDDIFNQLWKIPKSNPKKTVSTVCPLSLPQDDGSSSTTSAIPKRLWAAMTEAAGLSSCVWAEAPKKSVRKLASYVAESKLAMIGKATFKDEFVKAGGVDLKEIDMRTMQSKVCPGLFLCGELIDVDGVTGGFNFMNCWSSGYVAGSSAADYLIGREQKKASQL